MFLFGVKRHHTTTTAICTPTSTVTSLESLNLRRRRTTHLTMYTVVCIPNGQLIERWGAWNTQTLRARISNSPIAFHCEENYWHSGVIVLLLRENYYDSIFRDPSMWPLECPKITTVSRVQTRCYDQLKYMCRISILLKTTRVSLSPYRW